MVASLFGKLPAKRDFLTLNVSRAFLDVWEPWLQKSVATSRQVLGEGWQEAFRNAPIWRFWIGSGFCGQAALGAFMPSVDAVGRYFPLTIYAVEAPGMTLASPEIDTHEAWLHQVEDLLLTALDPGTDYDAVAAAVAALPSPQQTETAAAVAGLVRLADGGVLIRDFGADLPVAIRSARRLDHRRSFAGQTVWWTIGGEGYPPTAFVDTRMPDPVLFAPFLTGQFPDLPDA